MGLENGLGGAFFKGFL